MRIVVCTSIVILFIVGALLITIPTASADLPENIGNGPYIDQIVYKKIPYGDERRLALLAGEIDMDSVVIDPYYEDPSHIAELTTDPDIDIAESLKNGYTYVRFNCDIYPANITGFRRAFAFALNKTKIAIDAMNGYAQVHDSVVPSQNPFCIEDDLEYSYYDAQPDLGNAILDDLGFEISNTTGFRETPNGDPINIIIVYGAQKFEGIIEICEEAFASLNISVYSTLPCNCDLHEQMNVWSQRFYGSNLEWLAYQYWSERSDDYYYNRIYIPNTGFSNSSYDSWRDQLLYSQSYEDTFEAASEIQKILHYNVPLIPIYQDIYLTPYRNDKFIGHVLDSENSLYGPWTMLNIHLLDGTFGGAVTVGIYNEPLFNFWRTGATSGDWLLTNMYSALYTRDPDQQPYAQLAKSMTIETHADNPSVLDGNTRFTFEIRNDSVWSDGLPVTSDDVLFTFNYMLESADFGNPMGTGLVDLSALYSPRPGVVVFEFPTESYWLFDKIAYDFIVPKRIFENYSPEEWADWNIITKSDGQSLNCGPFVLTDYEVYDFYELTWNSLWKARAIPERIYLNIASILPSDDIEVEFPVFTISWNLTWNTVADGYLIGKNEGYHLDAVLETSPFAYTILLDSQFYSEGIWNHTDGTIDSITINFALPVLSVDQHNVTLLLNNGYDPIQVDTVIVTVNFPFSPLTLIIGGSASIIIVASLVILWNTKLRHFRLQHLDS